MLYRFRDNLVDEGIHQTSKVSTLEAVIDIANGNCFYCNVDEDVVILHQGYVANNEIKNNVIFIDLDDWEQVIDFVKERRNEIQSR